MATVTPAQSQTLWFNGLSVVALVVADLMANDVIREQLGGKIFYLMIAGSVINMVLRFYTTKPIQIRKPTGVVNEHDQLLNDAERKDAEETGLI